MIAIALAKDPKQRFAKALEHACQEEFIPTVVSPSKDVAANLPPTVFARTSSPDSPAQTPFQPFAKSEPLISPTILPRGKVSPPIGPLAVEELTLLHTLTGHRGAVMSVAISADGQTLVSGSVDETIKVWNLSTGKEARTLKGHTSFVNSVAISTDGQTLFSGSRDKMIKVWREHKEF